jgi:hypothetical protein
MTSGDAESPARRDERGQAPSTPPRKHRRVVRQGTETQAVSGVSADERPAGWSEGTSDGTNENANDDRLTRDVPPHW